jgi:arginyl-tRNA synthetase
LKATITEVLSRAVEAAAGKGLFGSDDLPAPGLEMARDRKFGDYATNIAMVLASRAKTNPRKLAEELLPLISEADMDQIIGKAEIAGPGFINLTMSGNYWGSALRGIMSEGADFARSNAGGGKKVQVEFVSANPTGPLHVGHGRGAVLGDALARIMEAAGFEVQREYYVNDAGNQIETLGQSVYARYVELFGRDSSLPEGGYQGDYIRELASEIRAGHGDRYLDMPTEEAVPEMARLAAASILDDIRLDLEEFGVLFDLWFSERTLFDDGAVQASLEELEEAGHLFREDDALWFRTTDTGDDKDRVVIKSDGSYTYFASDVAYHINKYQRGFDRVINIWGADHHGYIPRMKAAVQAAGRSASDLDIVLVQLVNLLRKGEQVAMSTRAGQFVTLRAVREEVGRDAARFTFLTRKSDSKLDFDLELAKEKSNDNPVFYVRYAHARICSILRNAAEAGLSVPRADDVDLELLTLVEEKELIRHIAALPDVVEGAALALEPHRLTNYLRDLATTLHGYYYHHRVISDDNATSMARLALVTGVKTAVATALGLLGVSAPERM